VNQNPKPTFYGLAFSFGLGNPALHEHRQALIPSHWKIGFDEAHCLVHVYWQFCKEAELMIVGGVAVQEHS